jgi:uncharacterized Tic20 family protein
MTSFNRTICNYPVKKDRGREYLGKFVNLYVYLFSFILLIVILMGGLTIYLTKKYKNNSEKLDNLTLYVFIGIVSMIFIATIFILIKSRKINYLHYVFVINPTSDIWVFDYTHPIIYNLYKNSSDKKSIKLGFYGVLCSLHYYSNHKVDDAKTMSFCEKNNIIDYYLNNYDESTNFEGLGSRISGIKNLKINDKYITFTATQQEIYNNISTKSYIISRKFTNTDELINALQKMTNIY